MSVSSLPTKPANCTAPLSLTVLTLSPRVQCAQKYGPGALKGMLAWLRHLAAAVGTAEILTEALGDCEEAQEYQQVMPAANLKSGTPSKPRSMAWIPTGEPS